jgi:hypothetical protein
VIVRWHNKTENHFSPFPRSRINLYTRLKIAMSILLTAGKAAGRPAGRRVKVSHAWNAAWPCCIPAYSRKTACDSDFKAALQGKAARQGCRARLPGKAAGQGCRARLPGKAADQGCRARLPSKFSWQGCRARLHGKGACNGVIC